MSDGNVKRYGMVVRLLDEKIEEYKALHANAWPGVLKALKNSHVRNFNIYLKQLDDGKHYLFGYFEYTGKDFEGDMAKVAADPTSQKWEAVCRTCHCPIQNRKPGEWWAMMEEVFHLA